MGEVTSRLRVLVISVAVLTVVGCGGSETGGGGGIDTVAPEDVVEVQDVAGAADLRIDVPQDLPTMEDLPPGQDLIDTIEDTVPDLPPEDTAPELPPVDTPCVPSCEDKECGDDGCGESCGECEDGQICASFLCCTPVDEVCNGLDDDCDGTVDEDFSFVEWDESESAVGAECGAGACAGGEVVCLDEATTGCSTSDLASPEVCDNEVDENCNGLLNECCVICDPACEVCSEDGECQVLYDEPVVTWEFGANTDTPFSLETNDSYGVELTEDGGLTLPTEQVLTKPYLWAANYIDNTVSKVDTVTGVEAGEYAVCANPSRTSVDEYGRVWVACRDDSQVAIIAGDLALCLDKDLDGQITTATDVDGDGQITGDEILPAGEDECVLFVGSPVIPGEDVTIWEKNLLSGCGNTGLRGLAAMGDNRAWLGSHCVYGYPGGSCADCSGWGCCANNPQALWLIKYEYNPWQPLVTGENPRVIVEKTITTGIDKHYGIAADQSGALWVSTVLAQLHKVDPDTGAVSTYGFSGNNYGIGVDYAGRIWTASWNTNSTLGWVFLPDTEEFHSIVERWDGGSWWESTLLSSQAHVRGVMPSGDPEHPYVYFVFSRGGEQTFQGNFFGIAKVHAETRKVVGIIELGNNGICDEGYMSGCGVTIDNEGDVWAVSITPCGNSEFDGANHPGSVAVEIDPDIVGMDLGQPYYINPAAGNGDDDEKATIKSLVDLGSYSYSYSDMSGYQLTTVVTQSGYYMHGFNGWGCCPGPQFNDAGCNTTTRWVEATVYMDSLPAGASVGLSHRTADCLQDLPSGDFSARMMPTSCNEDETECTFTLPLSTVGVYLDVRAILTPSEEGAAPVLQKVTVTGERVTCVAFDEVFETCDAIHQADAGCPSGPYLLDIDGEGDIPPLKTFCDMDSSGGGWTLVYKKSAAVASMPETDFMGGDLNPDDVSLMHKGKSYKDFSSPMVTGAWDQFALARVEVLKGGAVQQWMEYDLDGADTVSWFVKERLTGSSWTDLEAEAQNYWSISGADGAGHRDFFINRNYGGCASDNGWLVVNGDAPGGCPWEAGNTIQYSTQPTYQNWQSGDVGFADSMVILVK